MSLKMKVCAILIATATLNGCYRIDVQQGNILPEKAVYSIRNGMSQQQIEKTFGTPVMTDVFKGNELVYVYTFKPGMGQRHIKRLLVYFKNGRVVNYTTDVKQPSATIPAP